MLKKSLHALSYYFAIIICAFSLLYTLYGARIRNFVICDERANGSVVSKEACHETIPGVTPYTYKIDVFMPKGYKQTITLNRTYHNYRVGQIVTVVYDDDRLLHWYVSAEDWRYY